MNKVKSEEMKIIDRICLDICDGVGGRCQRYPSLSTTCDRYYFYLKAYEAGIQDAQKPPEKEPRNPAKPFKKGCD